MLFLFDSDRYSFRTLVGWWLGILGVILMIGFITFQARYLITGPQIFITTDLQGPQNTRAVELTGTAHNISRLWLNDRQIFTDNQGNFSEALVLENGYTIATLRAEDRYGRTTRVEYPLVYVAASFY